MDKQRLLSVIYKLQEQVASHPRLSGTAKGKLGGMLLGAGHTYASLDILQSSGNLLESLIKRGNGLLEEFKGVSSPEALKEKTARYIRLLHASAYDLTGNTSGLKLFIYFFMVTATLFMALTPQFYGFILPAIFILPILSGVRGVKKRNSAGFRMTLAVIPMSLMSGITWIRYVLWVALPAFGETVQSTARAWNVSQPAARLLIIIPGILSVVLVAASLITAYLGYKYRKMFV